MREGNNIYTEGTKLYALAAGHYVRLYELPMDLSDGAKALITDLARSQYIQRHTMKIAHSNGKRITQTDICRITGRSKPTISKLAKELQQAHVIGYDGHDYYFNPLYVRIGRELASIYTMSLFPKSGICKEYRDDRPVDFENESEEERKERREEEEQFRKDFGIELPY